MNVVDRDSIALLAGHHSWPAVSIYLPTHILPRQTAEDRIRLKNLVREACDKLVAEGMRDPEAGRFVDSAKALLEDDTFWRDAAHGLAIYLAEDEMTTLKLDVSVPEQVVVGDRFYIRPLLAAHRIDESFYVLALDKNQTRLFAGSRSEMQPVELEGVPTTFDDLMKYDQIGRTLTTHSISAGRPASRGGQHEGSSYSGHGNAKDSDVETTERYARAIEGGVAEALKDETAPLLVVATERLGSAYHAVNTYPHLFEHWVGGSSDYLTPAQLQELALSTLAPAFGARLDDELASLRENEGSALSSHDPAEIVVAAAEGRVRTLFLDESSGPFGVFDRDRHEVRELCEATPRMLRESKEPSGTPTGGNGDGLCGWDLGDLAAAETALHGGEVLLFTGEHPQVEGIAAVYRY